MAMTRLLAVNHENINEHICTSTVPRLANGRRPGGRGDQGDRGARRQRRRGGPHAAACGATIRRQPSTSA
jgi:hypothetical protein